MQKRLPILGLLLLPVLFYGRAQFGGSLRNDSAALLKNGAGIFGNSTEARAVFQFKAEGWRIYTDMRLSHYSGELYSGIDELKFDLVRSFIRISPSWMTLTIGKTYINFGPLSLFNPLEMDKELNLNDLARTKSGRAALTVDFPLGDFSGFKLYTAPEDPAWSAGCSLYTRIGGFDISITGNRIATNRNIAGISLKGDILLGLTLIGALHFDDSGNATFWEGTAALDYSFGSLYINAGCYYNGSGALDSSDYTGKPAADSFSMGRITIFLQLNCRIDEFLSLSFDTFANPHDRSLVLLPGCSWTIMDGLLLKTIVSLPLGSGNGEFAPSRIGTLALLLRLTAKF